LEISDLKRDRVLEKQVRKSNRHNAMNYEMFWPLKDASHTYKLRCENDPDQRKGPLEDILKKMDDRIRKHEEKSQATENRQRELEGTIMAKFACLAERNIEHPSLWKSSTELSSELNVSLRHPFPTRPKEPDNADDSPPPPAAVHLKPWVLVKSDQGFEPASVTAMKHRTRMKCRSDLKNTLKTMNDEYSGILATTESKRKFKAKLGADIDELESVLTRIETTSTPRTVNRISNRTAVMNSTMNSSMQRPATRA